MIERNHIEKILKINGMSPSEPDDVIRSVLLSARYNDDEIDTALMVLREDTKTKQVRVEGLHKVFRTDNALKPQEISDLLGIDVNLEHYLPPIVQSRTFVTSTLISVWILSLLLAVVGVLLYMHFNNVGIFHPSMG
jgi:hypothetical protein